MTAWVVRVGKHGEREQWALENSLAGGGFHEVGDLTTCILRDQIRAAVDAGFPHALLNGRANFTGQLWALRNNIKPGDLVVMPLKTTKKVALGICTSGYQYRSVETDGDRRHAIGVDWKTDDVSRANIKSDLLSTINGAMTIFRASKNNAEQRLRTLLDTGEDPGSAGASAPRSVPTTVNSVPPDDSTDVTDPIPAPTLEAIQDRVTTHLVENFKGHRLTELIAAILRVEGYVCDVSPPGPDQGVDIIAGRGPLGLDSPTLIVEVKSEAGQVGSTVIRGLQGAMSQHRADQGLLVAWGGLNKQAKAEIRTDRLTMRVWEAADILDHLFAVYDRLSEDMRVAIPLKRAWVLDEEAG